MIEFTVLKELMLIRQVNQKSVIFNTIGTFQIKSSDVCNRCHDVSMFRNLNDITILNINAKYRFDQKQQNTIKNKIYHHILKFGDIENKTKFYCYKSSMFLEDVYVENCMQLLVACVMIIKLSHCI